MVKAPGHLRRNRSRSGMWACLLATLCIPGLAWAQIDEIVVSVRKKAENLQDVPMSVTAFDADTIRRQGIRNVTGVAKYTTSIQFDESFSQSDTRIVVRGLSPTRGRQNIALLVDGIDVSSEAITSSGGSLLVNTRLIDIERIEVVLGPQMAVYGRSAFNGALQYVTKDASPEFEAEVKADVNAENGYEIIGSVSGPILGDALGYRLNATGWEQKGFYRNSITGARVGGNEGYGLALTLNSEIGDNWSFKFRTEYTDDESQVSPQAFLLFNDLLATPSEAFDAGVAVCDQALIDTLSDWDNPNPPPGGQGVPGNNQAWLDRALRTIDPAAIPGFLEAYGPDALDPTSQNFTIPGGGSYCQETLTSYTGQIPSAEDLTVALMPNPLTPGRDFEGFDRELLRVSLVAEWASDRFSFTSLTGFTDDDNTEEQDSNAYGVPGPGPQLVSNVNTFAFDNAKTTQQFSQDLRFATTLDGPINGTIGGLYWTEDVNNTSQSITAQGSGTHCFWNSVTGQLNPVDATDGCTGYTDTPIAPYQVGAAPFRRPSPADRETDHWSIYGSIDFQFLDNWTLTFEGRYNDEDVVVDGPIFFDPGASGGPGGLNPCGIFFRECVPYDQYIAEGKYYSDSYFPWLDEDANGVELMQFVPDQALIDQIPATCWQEDSAAIVNSVEQGPAQIVYTGTQSQITGPDGQPIMVDTPAWQDGVVVVREDGGTGPAVPNPNAVDYFNPWCHDSLTKSESWFTPKILLDWAATDDTLFYASWSRAQKPGGFSLLTVGSSGLDRELTEFEPEKMVVWEVGGNTAWLENTLIVNTTLFFQDFTDKQALTSAPGNDGRLVSKIENAGAAEVWGAELRVEWSPISEFLGGNWRFNGSYTWLDTEYTDFTVETGSPITAAGAGNCEPTLVGGEIVCTVSYTGNKLEDAPEGAFAGQAAYYYSFASETTAYFETDLIWQDKRFTGITNSTWTESYSLINLRLGLTGDRWDTMVYVENAFDNDTVQFGGGGPGLGCCFALGSSIDISDSSTWVGVDLPPYSTAFMPRPRVVGMRVAYRFGGE